MRPMVLLVLAIAAVLYLAPSSPSGAGGPTVTPVGIAVGLGGIVALVLVAWYMVPRRRRGVGSGTSETPDDATTSPTAEEMATAALHRRTLRRAKVRLEEDPILASMGVGSAKRPSKPGVSRARRAARRSPPT